MPSSPIDQAKRIIIKTGSVLVTDESTGTPRHDWLEALAADVAALTQAGKEILIVSSGAISLGRKKLGLPLNISSSLLKLEEKQAAAAVGQIELAHAYQSAFQKQGLKIAQILLSPNDTESRRAHLNARATISTLLTHNIIPVINENDTTATEEIRFGDNDRLAARVAQMTEANLLLILSTTDGLYTGDPGTNAEARHISEVTRLTEDYFAIAGEAPSGPSTGGMKSKIQAAKMAVDAGTRVVITSGKAVGCLSSYIAGEQKSTVFNPTETPDTARKKWIRSHLKPAGTIIIDDGAESALREGKSLLPAGVVEISGSFVRGDAVKIENRHGYTLGMGIIAYGSDDAFRILGKHSRDIEDILGYAGRDELIHRNDLAMMET